MRKQLTIAVLGLGLTASPLAFADIVGAGASIGYWNADLSGSASQGSDRVDVENDLNLDRSTNLQFSAALEHPIPLLPNVRVGFTRLEQDGNGSLEGNFGDLLNVGVTDVRSELDLDQLDLTFYYEILDNWVNLDAGLTVRSLEGDLYTAERGNLANANRTSVDAILPLAYAAARFDIPVTGLSFGATGHAIAFDGDSIFDLSAYGQYDLSLLRFQAGYRQLSVDVEDGSGALDIEIGGPFVSLGVDF